MVKKIYTKYREKIMYLIIGGTTTIVSILAFYLFLYAFHINYMISNVLSFVIAVIYAYITNKIIVFQSKTKGFVKIFKEFTIFVSSRLLSLGVETLTLYLLVDKLLVSEAISKLIVQVIVFILNYIFSKIFVFRKAS